MNRYLRSFLRFTRTLQGIIALSLTSLLLIIGIAMTKATAQSAGTLPISQTAAAQIQALGREKRSRNLAQRKVDSNLLYAAKAQRRDALVNSVSSLTTFVKPTTDNKVRVNIKTNGSVTGALLEKIKATGSEILFSLPNYNAIQALVPLTQVENIASNSQIKSIRPYIAPELDSKPRDIIGTDRELLASNDSTQVSQAVSAVEQTKEPLGPLPQMAQHLAQVPRGAITDAGVVTSEGDIALGVALARSTYKVDGSYTKKNPAGGSPLVQRVKIGVISDSYNNLGGAATDIAKGDLPEDGVTLAGSGDLPGGGIDEGRAMLQIIHDLVPGAKLYFATGAGGEEDFANNIRALRKAGCDIIVDDLRYSTEPVFQDGIIAQAVNDVTANGALYFASAGNAGNKNDGTSGVWEGNFVDGGAAPLGLSGRVHQFANGSTGLYNKITGSTGRLMRLQWSDPWGQSTNDYDLYVLNSTGTAVIAASTNFQGGTDDPIELVNPQAVGSRVIVVQYSGSRRFLYLSANRGRLEISTPGQTEGHSAAANAFSVAAVNAQGRTTPFTGGAANPVETFSSDGPRRIFYKADGTPITPGNFLSTGGVVRQKPEIAAADGVKTTLPPGGLNPFFGTSAAAPHAAAVAGLLKSFRPSLTSAQMRSLLTSTALDIEATGVDQDSGYGIIMANRVLDKAAKTSIVTP
ncbi:MAG TPA: S8 family serine peptidase [Coleofasciculaceae cyanobacterium]|jgi:hypothetical protein